MLRAGWLALGWLGFLALLAGCGRAPETSNNLLAMRAPIEARGVTCTACLTDGVEAEPGSRWQNPQSAEFESTRAQVTYDLGKNVAIRGVYLQADNNDSLIVSLGDARGNFRDVWVAKESLDPGMRSRYTNQLDAQARYLRVRFGHGDGRFSISEFQAFTEVSGAWPPEVPRVSSDASAERQRSATLIWAVVIAGLLLADRKSFSLSARLAEAVAATAVTAYAIASFTEGGPPDAQTIAFAKAMLALVAASTLVRLALWREAADRRVLSAGFAATALLAIFAFYNMGTPQFRHAGTGDESFIHYWDMRVYYPTVKYFEELGYDDLYWASVEAYLEDTGHTLEQVGDHPIRDLRDYRMTTIGAARAEIEGVKSRFSPERWAAFGRDMAYFRSAMGDGYLESLGDHGANATPAWMLGASPLFRSGVAMDASLLLGAMLDPLLLLAFFVAAGRAFGWRTALLCLLLFGISSFPMHGSNWAGATLRNDWMVLLGLSLCALKTERWVLGGALLGWSAMIRAFPVLGVAALALPTLWWGVDFFRRDRRLPSWAEFVAARQPFLRAALGVSVAVVLLGAASTAMFGAEQGWGRWSQKITAHASKPNVNHVGLRAALTYTGEALQPGEDWEQQQERVIESRRSRIALCALIFGVAGILACRRVEEHRAVALGMMMLPIFFYPANYYLHCVFLVPLLAVDRTDEGVDWRWAGTGLVLLAMCFAEYFSAFSLPQPAKFAAWSVGLLIAWGVILGERVVAAVAAPVEGGDEFRGSLS